jgi:hypothetical protein
MQVDGRGVELAAARQHGRRPHGVVQHGGENAALDEAGRIAELRLAVEADAQPAALGVMRHQVPAEQSRAGRHGDAVEDGLGHGGRLALAC